VLERRSQHFGSGIYQFQDAILGTYITYRAFSGEFRRGKFHRLPLECSHPFQTIKKNKGDCTQILEQIYEVIAGIICLHINSDTGGELPPKLLDNLGNFAEYLVLLF
jgi:hypothetical protein